MIKVEVFKKITEDMAKIYEAKNEDYGDSFSKQFKKDNKSCLIRLNDKLNRLEELFNKKDIRIKNESVEDTLIDLANYSIMTLMELRDMNEGRYFICLKDQYSRLFDLLELDEYQYICTIGEDKDDFTVTSSPMDFTEDEVKRFGELNPGIFDFYEVIRFGMSE